MSDDPAALGTELIKTLLQAAPRDQDGEVVATLVGLHRALGAYIEDSSLDTEAVNGVNAVLDPIENLLTRYRPRSLYGLKMLLGFIADDLDGDPSRSRQAAGWVRAAQESAALLALKETERLQDSGVPRLRLDSPVVGHDLGSTGWVLADPRR